MEEGNSEVDETADEDVDCDSIELLDETELETEDEDDDADEETDADEEASSSFCLACICPPEADARDKSATRAIRKYESAFEEYILEAVERCCRS